MAKPKNPTEVDTLRAEVAALTAERDHLRAELERARASVRHCNGCSECQGEAPATTGEYNPLGVVRGAR